MTEKLRITLVCVSLRGGGTERIVSRIANRFAFLHKVVIITVVPGQPFFPLDESISVWQPELSNASTGKVGRLLRQLHHLFIGCRRAKPGVCLVFGEDIAAAATLMARMAGARTIWVFFRGRPERSLTGLNGRLNPLFLKLANRLFVQTVAGFEALRGSYPARKMVVWPNPLELPAEVSPPAERERLIINVGSIGRLKNQKGLLNVFEKIQLRECWRLMFVGDGPGRTDLQEAATASDRAALVSIEGERQDVDALLDQAAIFAFSSFSEGFPNALAEAMAAGCACISYDCPTGPTELIEHGVNGFLVELGDEEAYARLLQRLIDDTALRARFSHNARESMKRFEAGAVLAKLDQLMEEITEAQGERRKAHGKS